VVALPGTSGELTRLVDACLNAATKLGLTTWLDATPAGANVYGPLGFTPTLQLRRLRLEAPKGISAAQTLSTCSVADFIARDVRAMGFDRGALLTEFGGRTGSRTVSLGNTVALVRDGRTARHIGPIFAETHDGALALVDAIVRSEQGPWLLDAVQSQEDLSREHFTLNGCSSLLRVRGYPTKIIEFKNTAFSRLWCRLHCRNSITSRDLCACHSHAPRIKERRLREGTQSTSSLSTGRQQTVDPMDQPLSPC